MKKTITYIMTAMLFCSCAIDNGIETGRTKEGMRDYAEYLYSVFAVEPAYFIKTMLSMDEYLNATDEEKTEERFEWHRNNIFHEDDDTFFVGNIGQVHTYGKSFMEEGTPWKAENYSYTYDGQGTWTVGKNVRTKVTFTGLDEKGRYHFLVDVYATDKADTSDHNDDYVSATFHMPAGPVSIVAPDYIEPYYSGNRYNFPEGHGTMRIDFMKNNEIADWAELTYSENGLQLECRTSLD